ncbi:MAG: transporter substrate-binding domain-containing protein [Geminicoccaceae bacterium]
MAPSCGGAAAGSGTLWRRGGTGRFSKARAWRSRLIVAGVLATFCCWYTGTVLAADPAGHTLTVGTRQAPPFAMKGPDGAWQGIAIELWAEIAKELGLTYTLTELARPADLVDGVAEGRLDAAVAPLTITAEREARLDFSHPFFNTGLGIAVQAEPETGAWRQTLDRLMSTDFLRVVGVLAALLVGVGALMWLAEHRRNAEQFERGPMDGIGSGFWWAAVTMTTVGYGDKAPRTTLGRLLGVIWMFAGVILISAFTAQITASLTVNSLGGSVTGPADLPRSRVGVVGGTATIDYLTAYRVPSLPYPSLDAALQALAAGQLDAVVHDEPILRYTVNETFQAKLRVLDETFADQEYGIALQTGSPLREPVNRAILHILESETWVKLVTGYLGRPPS